MKKAGFPHVTFHGLRHTHASLLLKWNVSPKDVSARLGHSSTKMTLDVYGHVVPDTHDEVAELLERNLFARMRKRGGQAREE